MKKVCLLLILFFVLNITLTGCNQEPWIDMVDTLMRGDYERANKQYLRIEKNYVNALKTSDYVYQYIENIVTSYKKDQTTFATAEKKLNLFSLLNMPLYNLEKAKTEINRIQSSRESFEQGRELYLEESYYDAYLKFKQVETDDDKYYEKSLDYLLSVEYVMIYSEDYSDATDVILDIDINEHTLSKLSEYSVELLVRLLYYENDIDRAQKINDELIQTIILMDESVRESLKDWADKLKSLYSKPEHSAVCISFLSDNIEDTFYKLEKTDELLEDKKTDYAFIILKSINIRQDTIGYIAPRMTEILSQYISLNKADFAQVVVDTIFAKMDDDQMVNSLVSYIKNHIEKEEYLNKIDMSIGQ